MALDRAVGVMTWHLHHGGSDEEALARASAREVDLTETDLIAALAWAKAACNAAKACEIAPDDMTLAELLDKCGVPWRDGNG